MHSATQVPEPPAMGSPTKVNRDHAYARVSKRRKRRAIPNPPPKPKVCRAVMEELPTEEVGEEEEVQEQEDKHDLDYRQPSEGESSSDEERPAAVNIPEKLVTEKKFMVFDSKLRELFMQARCSVCGQVFLLPEPDEQLGTSNGSALQVTLECINGHIWKWGSQPTLGKMPAGNLLISAASLFSGQIYNRLCTFAGFLNLEFVSYSSFKEHQNLYLFPVVHTTWENEQQTLLDSLNGRSVRLAGDGRCDSPGYSAKYCTYTMMDMDTQKVVDFEVVQVTQTTSSVAMEKMGFEVVLERLLQKGVTVTQICTDRHIGINALMNKKFKDIEHQVDVWHLAKSVAKHLLQKAKLKECGELHAWMASIKNHLWWSSQTCNGDKVELLERWRSVAHHVTNKHEWVANQKFHQCAHPPYSQEEEKKRKWMKPDSEAHQALTSVLNKKTLLDGVGKVTKFCHTGELEVYHGMMTKYVPKRVQYPRESMIVRTTLAALDHNHNTNRNQATVKKSSVRSGREGAKRYRVACPKSKKKWVCKPIYEGKQYGYVYDMMATVITKKLAQDTSSPYVPPDLPPNIAPSDIERPSKEELVEAHRSRFGE